MKKWFCFLPLLFSLLAATCFANDTDLYTASGAGVEPNILIMFDNSGSMNDPAPAYVYDPGTTYPPDSNNYGAGKVYYKSGATWILFKDSIASVTCSTARSRLSSYGHYEGYNKSPCNGKYATLDVGDYLNFLANIGGAGNENKPKLTIAKQVITEFVNTVQGVRLGVMVFNPAINNNSEGGHIQSWITGLDDAGKAQLTSDINAIVAETWTPLAETLYESGLYFKGGPSYFNKGVNYISPIQYHCQNNYVIIITDGISTQDKNSILASAIGDQDKDGREPGGAHQVSYADNGTDYLDDVAKYLYDNDLRSDLDGKQNITTYTIGFTTSSDLLERTATQGHGKFYYCEDSLALATSFQNIVNEILEKSSSFVAPIVPVSRLEKTTAGDKIYLAFFKPKNGEAWSGNIKKFGVAQTDDAGKGIHVGDILDANGNLALDSTGQFYSTAKSYWTSISMDGGDVEKGGVGEVLLNRSSARNIYTYLGTNADLTHSSNAFALTNASITPDSLGVGTGNTVGRNNLINFVTGIDAYDDNTNGNTTEKRDWILGAFLHSRPFVVQYATRTVVYGGSNDGMLHAFDDSDGSELWGFIPYELLNTLQALHSDVLSYFVDGSPKCYLAYDSNGNLTQAILIFGERRGGNRYYALDITNPLVPKFLWKIGPDVADYAEMGQSWSSPMLGTIDDGTPSGKPVVFIGGGYDDNQDNESTPLPPDSKGRAIYVVNVLDGSRVWRYSQAENSAMSYSIPSDIARLDVDGDGKIDRLYAGDMGGRMWRFDLVGSDTTKWVGKIIFKSNPDGATALRKIFYPPDVTLENDGVDYEMFVFGTGDREHPKETTIINRLYAVKDKNLTDKTPPTPYVEADLVNVTNDLLQTGNDKQKSDILQDLKTKSGWYITFDPSSGEKSLAPPVVFYKIAYFTTFSPTFGGVSDPCFVGEGTARLYALQYTNGLAILNLDVTNDVSGNTVLAQSDRSKIIGTAIPSGVIVTFIGGQAVAYVGVGGGVFTPELASTKSLIPIYWRIVY